MRTSKLEKTHVIRKFESLEKLKNIHLSGFGWRRRET
jgi:hypothetical protein